MDLKNKRVLITGAKGFIGGRLAERLASEPSIRVRGLVRDTLPLPHPAFEVVLGDVVDSAAIERAVEGCDLVVHCAAMQSGRAKIDEYRRVNVGATVNLLRAAKNANVQRFIHLSTINVHGVPPPRDANADSPLVFNDGFYSVTKAKGERAAWQFARDHHFPLVVIRPACTYGPRSVAWTLTPLNRVRRGAPVLIDQGEGMCNAVYIDNLVDLIILAMQKDAAVGQAFIGAEGRGVPWREFYGAYARMARIEKINTLPRWLGLLAATGFEMLARVNGYPPRLDRASVEFYSHRVVFEIEKATRLLGYAPVLSFEEGMARTEKWLHHEKYL